MGEIINLHERRSVVQKDIFQLNKIKRNISSLDDKRIDCKKLLEYIPIINGNKTCEIIQEMDEFIDEVCKSNKVYIEYLDSLQVPFIMDDPDTSDIVNEIEERIEEFMVEFEKAHTNLLLVFDKLKQRGII